MTKLRVVKVTAPWWVRMLAQIVVRLHNFVRNRIQYIDMGEMPMEGLDIELPEQVHPMDIPLKPKKDTYH